MSHGTDSVRAIIAILYHCPLCQLALARHEKTLTCPSGHTFDYAREGYINLLPSHHQRSGQAGDSGQMIASRRQFLTQGHYDPLVAELRTQLGEMDPATRLVDTGCGDGYFTDQLKTPVTHGIDISKPAIKLAAKLHKDIAFAVASSKRLPFGDDTFDIGCVILAPFFEDVIRIMKPGGMIIRVTPGQDHLVELKRLMYSASRPHERAGNPAGLRHTGAQEVRFEMTLDAATRKHLVDMTPMQHRVSPTQYARAMHPGSIAVTAHFWIDRYAIAVDPWRRREPKVSAS